MCQSCVQHGDGGKWYFNTSNYAQKMYKLRKKEVQRKGAEANPQTMAEDLVKEAIDARTIDPDNFPMPRQAFISPAYPSVILKFACWPPVPGISGK